MDPAIEGGLPMTPAAALHTAARRYCIERIAYWHARYAQLGHPSRHQDYPPSHKNVFPRYQVLEAILVEVERLRPEQFDYLRVARNRLWSTGQSAASMFTETHGDAIKQQAQQQERDLFSAFIDELSDHALPEVAPLPYRRTLEAEESQARWEQLRLRFGIRLYEHWYPLDGPEPDDAKWYDADEFARHVPIPWLRGLLRRAGGERLWELREYGPEYELDIDLFEPVYNGSEGFWSPASCDWVIYASHEATITVSGAWLLEQVGRRW